MGEYNRNPHKPIHNSRPTQASYGPDPKSTWLFDNLNFADILSISNKMKMEFVIDNQWNTNLKIWYFWPLD